MDRRSILTSQKTPLHKTNLAHFWLKPCRHCHNWWIIDWNWMHCHSDLWWPSDSYNRVLKQNSLKQNHVNQQSIASVSVLRSLLHSRHLSMARLSLFEQITLPSHGFSKLIMQTHDFTDGRSDSELLTSLQCTSPRRPIAWPMHSLGTRFQFVWSHLSSSITKNSYVFNPKLKHSDCENQLTKMVWFTSGF